MHDSASPGKYSQNARRSAEDMARLGSVISERYELIELLGHGGMGAVYKARHLQLDRLVAVKFLLSDIASDPLMRHRFLHEATLSGKISHPNVVQLMDYDETPSGSAYIVVEFLDGTGLDQLIKTEIQIEPARAVRIFKQICAGVAAAHARGIIHSDLKPANIMLVHEQGQTDFVKIVDFGLARALDSGEESQRLKQRSEVFGSPIYMAPEQCRGKDLDERSDIYALGVVMYESLIGKVPFLGANATETIARQMHELPKTFAELRPDLEIPAGLEAIVMKALEKEPDRRQASMLQLRKQLSDALRIFSNANSNNTQRAAVAEHPQSAKTLAHQTETKVQRSNESSGKKMPLSQISRRTLFFLLAAAPVLFSVVFLAVPSTRHFNNLSIPLLPSPPLKRNLETGKVPEKPSSVIDHTTGNGKEPSTKNSKAAAGEQALHGQTLSGKALPVQPKKKEKLDSNGLNALWKAQTAKIARHRTTQARTISSEDLAVPQISSKRHHDWQDYTDDYEKKQSYTHSWSVKPAGSQGEPQ